MGRCVVQLASGRAVVKGGRWSHPVPAIQSMLQKTYDPMRADGSIPDPDLWAARNAADGLRGRLISSEPIRQPPPGAVP